MSTTFPDSPALLDSTGQVIAQKLQGIINALGGGGGTVIIEEYDSSVLRYPNTGETGGYTYKVGDYCSYNNSIYFCKIPVIYNATTPVVFDSNSWYDATDDIVTELSNKPGIVITNNADFIELYGDVGTHNIYNSGHMYTHVEGIANTIGDSYDSNKVAYCSHAEGNNNYVKSMYSHVEGQYNEVSGNTSHAEGFSCAAKNTYTHAEGYSCRVEGQYSHVEGHSNNCYANYSHVEGTQTGAYGNYHHVEGQSQYVYGTGNHAEGAGNSFDSSTSPAYCHVEGTGNGIYSYNNTAASLSHVEGQNNQLRGVSYSHVEGKNNGIYGNYSHAEGFFNYAYSDYTHVGGQSSYAGGFEGRKDAESAFAHGNAVKVYNYAEAGFGYYNNSKDAKANYPLYAETGASYSTGDRVRYEGTIYAAQENISAPAGSFDSTKWSAGTNPETYSLNPTIFSVGNGTSSVRSNAFEVLRDGTGYLKNDKRIITTEEVPDPPTTDGTYTLQVTVNNGQLTYEWV